MLLSIRVNIIFIFPFPLLYFSLQSSVDAHFSNKQDKRAREEDTSPNKVKKVAKHDETDG